MRRVFVSVTARPRGAASAWHRAATAALAAVWLASAAVPVPAQPARTQKLDQERALAERGRGGIVPLEQLVKAVAQQIPGRQVGVELEDDDGELVYEIKWLLPDGRRVEIEIDARDGTWLQLKGQRLETVFHRPAGARRP